MRQKNFLIFAALALVAVCVAYANHFHNSFHFDDSHAIVTNVYIRDLHYIPLFFKDARTGSSLPANQAWRPVLMTQLAIDYHLGHGLNDTLWFHISTFFWFLIQLILMFILFHQLLDAAAPGPANQYVALFGVAWYGLHPAIAETVNYICQSADLLSTLGGSRRDGDVHPPAEAPEVRAVLGSGGHRVDGQGAGSGFLRHLAGVHISLRRGRPMEPAVRGGREIDSRHCRLHDFCVFERENGVQDIRSHVHVSAGLLGHPTVRDPEIFPVVLSAAMAERGHRPRSPFWFHRPDGDTRHWFLHCSVAGGILGNEAAGAPPDCVRHFLVFRGAWRRLPFSCFPKSKTITACFSRLSG